MGMTKAQRRAYKAAVKARRRPVERPPTPAQQLMEQVEKDFGLDGFARSLKWPIRK